MRKSVKFEFECSKNKFFTQIYTSKNYFTTNAFIVYYYLLILLHTHDFLILKIIFENFLLEHRISDFSSEIQNNFCVCVCVCVFFTKCCVSPCTARWWCETRSARTQATAPAQHHPPRCRRFHPPLRQRCCCCCCC